MGGTDATEHANAAVPPGHGPLRRQDWHRRARSECCGRRSGETELRSIAGDLSLTLPERIGGSL